MYFWFKQDEIERRTRIFDRAKVDKCFAFSLPSPVSRRKAGVFYLTERKGEGIL